MPLPVTAPAARTHQADEKVERTPRLRVVAAVHSALSVRVERLDVAVLHLVVLAQRLAVELVGVNKAPRLSLALAGLDHGVEAPAGGAEALDLGHHRVAPARELRGRVRLVQLAVLFQHVVHHLGRLQQLEPCAQDLARRVNLRRAASVEALRREAGRPAPPGRAPSSLASGRGPGGAGARP